MCVYLYICAQWWRTLLQLWGGNEDEWDAADKGVVVYSGNSGLSLEPAYLFSRVFECVCICALVCAI